MQQIIPNSKFSFLKIFVLRFHLFLLFYYMYESLLLGVFGGKRGLRNESGYSHILLKCKLDELSEGQLSSPPQVFQMSIALTQKFNLYCYN